MCIFFLVIRWENFDELEVCDEISDRGVDEGCFCRPLGTGFDGGGSDHVEIYACLIAVVTICLVGVMHTPTQSLQRTQQ
jgi:hypothetical protein